MFLTKNVYINEYIMQFFILITFWQHLKKKLTKPSYLPPYPSPNKNKIRQKNCLSFLLKYQIRC